MNHVASALGRKRFISIVAAVLCAVYCRFLVIIADAAEPAVANPSLTRVVEGRYETRELKGGRVVGVESFRLNVHSNGSRCIAIWSNSATRGTQITADVCVDRQFRPLQAYARYWIGGAYRGAAWINVDGASLSVHSSTGGAATTLNVAVPARFSLGTHPISADAWHVAALGSEGGAAATSFTLNPAGDRSVALTGQLVQIPVERLADERVTVPAGTFVARRIRLGGRTDYWVNGDDWIVVRMATGDSERVLTQYRQLN